MATSQTWMEGFQTRARAALEGALSRLDPEWGVLAELRIDGPEDDVAADYVAIHAGYGIALINARAGGLGDQIERLRDLLARQKFATLFPGNLPIVTVSVRPADAALIGRRIDAAFAKAPRLTVRNPDWAAAVQDLLVPLDTETAEAAPAPAPPNVSKPSPRRNQSPEQAPAAPRTRLAAARADREPLGTSEKSIWGVAAEKRPTAPEQQSAGRGESRPPAAPAADERRRMPEALHLDRADDMPRARAVGGEGLVARRDDAIVGTAPSAPAPQWRQWASAAAIVALVVGTASWWTFSARERSASLPAGSVVADIAPAPPPENKTPAESAKRTSAAPSIALSPPQAVATATSPARPATPDPAPAKPPAIEPSPPAPSPPVNVAPQASSPPPAATALATPPVESVPEKKSVPEKREASTELSQVPAKSTPTEPSIAAPSASSATPTSDVATAAIEAPKAPTQPAPPASPAPAAAPVVAAEPVAAQPPLPRPRAPSSKSVVASAKPPSTTLLPERAAPPSATDTPRPLSRQGGGKYAPANRSEPPRNDSPPLDIADLPPLEASATPSQPSTPSASAGGMHGPTSLLPPSPVVQTSVATATSAAPPTEVCRSYTATKTLLGQSRPVSGVTCRGQDGQWRIITELPN